MPEPKERPPVSKAIQCIHRIQTDAHLGAEELQALEPYMPPEAFEAVAGYLDNINRNAIDAQKIVMAEIPKAERRRADKKPFTELTPEEEELLHPDNSMYE